MFSMNTLKCKNILKKEIYNENNSTYFKEVAADMT